MQIDDIPVLKYDDRGTIYRCEPINYIVRYKGTVSADHTHSEKETLYLVDGRAELTVGTESKNIEAPAKVFIPSNKYHKLVALTDIRLIRV